MKTHYLTIIFTLIFTSSGCGRSEGQQPLELLQAFAGNTELDIHGVNQDIPVDRSISLYFSEEISQSEENSVILLQSDSSFEVSLTYSGTDAIILTPAGILEYKTDYLLRLERVIGSNGNIIEGIEINFTTVPRDLEILRLEIDGTDILEDPDKLLSISVDPYIEIFFNAPVSSEEIENHTKLTGPGTFDLTYAPGDSSSIIRIRTTNNLQYVRSYEFSISSEFTGIDKEPFKGTDIQWYTQVDSTYKFPEVTDDELLTIIQKQTFKYFWDFAHPVSGLARERNTSGDLVTIGGSGFGVMAIIVGIERGFISRSQGISRLATIVNFLQNNADRFHGVWSHWLSGSSGSVIPFSNDDDGGDLVETAFMIQALFTLRQYLDPGVPAESSLINAINTLIDEVEWSWYTQGGQDVLYWHWSPNFGWQKNHAIRGWNEALIIYVLAASSETYPIEREVYEKGWARNGNIKNTSGNSYYGYQLPLRSDMGGPLFFAHYSFLGLNPRNLEDQYADYWNQNVMHTKINRAYCIDNPSGYPGYSESSWGLTASDGNSGYSAHSPNNDRGVITPTAAISSLPYTPEYSMEAMRFFYYILGDKIWGEYGFYDAFNISANWYANSYLAIDQGPIICMIENYRSGMLWDLFMSAPEVQNGLKKLGFRYKQTEP